MCHRKIEKYFKNWFLVFGGGDRTAKESGLWIQVQPELGTTFCLDFISMPS